ncbi:MAG: Uma2 family endonuclease [Caldilineaceae bacterium]|nr:Uma2 family endonuclease [Caldilineaceae bacterium]
MTREARAARSRRRQADLAAWERRIEALPHYLHYYAYDTRHEYGDDWTSDPDYPAEGISLFEYDEDGMMVRDDPRAQEIETDMRRTVQQLIGKRVTHQAGYTFMPETAAALGRYTDQGKPANTVRPDLLVMPQPEDLIAPPDLRPRPDDAVPELVLEILSESTAAKDLGDKLALYQHLGVHEYLLYDLGGKRGRRSRCELLLYRLEHGAYVQQTPDDDDAYRSVVLNARIRMQPPAAEDEEPIFQWHEAATGHWRDYRSDIARFARVEGRAEGALKVVLGQLARVLPTNAHPGAADRIAAHWRAVGMPANAGDLVLDVMAAPERWRTILGLSLDAETDTRDADHTPTPGEHS